MIVTSKIPSAISDLCLPATLKEKPTFPQPRHKMFPLAAAAFIFLFFYFFSALTFQIYENDPLTAEITDSLQLKAINLQTEASGKKWAFITQQRREKRSRSEAASDIVHVYFLITNKYFFQNSVCVEELKLFPLSFSNQQSEPSLLTICAADFRRFLIFSD